MNEIYQGDNGTSLILTITDDEKVVDLSGSIIEVVIKYKATGIKKQATIIDAVNGKCEVVLSSEDVAKDGIYSLQATVIFEDERTFSSNVQRFIVNKKIGYVPVIGGSTGNVGDSAINGNIIVNGIEIRVYDDALIRGDINNLKQSQHTHANKSDLDRLGVNAQSKLTIDGVELVTGGVGGSTVADSTTNGNILVNGQEIIVYNDQTVKSDIASILNMDIINRLGISPNGKLTIDGIEQTFEPSQPTNTAPSISSSYSTTNVNDSTSISIPYTVTDTEGGNLSATYSIDGIANTATISTGSNTWNVGTLSAGSHTLTIQVKDSGNLTSNTLTFNLTVSVTNTAPSISSSYSTTTAYSNDSISIPYTITDAQGGSLTATYSKDGVTSTSTVSTGANTWSVGTLAVGSHTLTIQVADNGGLNSNTLTFNITVSASADTTAPYDISGLSTGTATINSIPVSWSLSPSGDVANYEVAYSSNGGSSWTVASALVNNSSTSFNITGLVAGTNYTIRVVAIDTSSNRSTGVTVVKSTAASVNYVLSATPSTGTYNATQNVVLSTNPSGATIYYTTNGSTPTSSSSVYSSSISVSANTTIKFFAQDSVGNVSSVQTATYTIDTVAPSVTVEPVAGTYSSTQSVSLTASEAATIYFTTNGTAATTSSTVYTTPISISATTTINYLVKDAAGNQSTGTVTYTIGSNVTGVSLDKTTATIDQNNTLQLNAIVSPSNATNKNVIWSSSNQSVATVNNVGLVTGVGVGTATITVTTEDGNKTAICSLTVNQVIIGFDYNNLVASPDGSTVTFDQTVNGESDWVHPSVMYFENGWQGHKWWMGVSPYPNTQGAWENTYIFYSDDGDNWKTPAGITGTVFPLLTGFNNNSDPNLFMDYDGVTMHLLNRMVYSDANKPANVTTSTGSVIEIISSTDGINWTARQTILDSANLTFDIVAPSVEKYNGKYYMFGTRTDQQDKLYVFEATTPTGTWTQINVMSTGTLGTMWHTEVRYLNQEFIVLGSTNGSSGGNLMLGKFLTPMDTTIIGRNNALGVPNYDVNRKWTNSFYKSSLVVKNNNDIEIFAGYKGPQLDGTTDWRVGRIPLQRLPQTLDLSSEYVETATYTDNATQATFSTDFYKHAYQFTITDLSGKFVIGYASTTNYIGLYIESGILRAELWKSGSFWKNSISYGISVGDIVTMTLDENLEIYVNGRLVFTKSNVQADLNLYGMSVGATATGKMSGIKVYKKSKYIYSLASAQTYKATAKTEFTTSPDNFIMVDEFNRANGIVGTSDNGVEWEAVNLPKIASNQFKAGGNDLNIILTPYEGNVQLLWERGSTTYNALFLQYTDSNNYIKFLTPQTTSRSFTVTVKESGTTTSTNYTSWGDNISTHSAFRLEIIDGYLDVYYDNVQVQHILLPVKSFAKKIGLTGQLAADSFDYFIIKQLPSTVPVLRMTPSTSFTTNQSVKMVANGTGTKIYYTLDGSTPTTSSTLYTAPIDVTSTKTVKAYAVSADGSQSSAVKTVVYTLVTPTIAFGDDFNRADTTSSPTGLGTTSVGAKTWTSLAGVATSSAQILSNVAKFTADSAFIVDGGSADGELTAKLTTVTTPFEGSELIFRYTDDSNYMMLRFSATTIYVFGKVNSTTFTQYATFTTTIANGNMIKVVSKGQTTNIYVNSVLVGTFISSYNKTGTKYGISGKSGAGFDDIQFSAYV